MKLTESLVSVILPVYNAGSELPRVIESLLKQTYQNLEIIIVDDKSKDDTYKMAQILKKCDNRIRVYRNKKRYGVAICLNRGIRKASGQFVAFMNQTDIASPYKVKKQVEFLCSHPKTVAVGTQCVLVGETNQKEKTSFPESHEQIYPTLLHGISMRFETALINRHLLPKDLIKFTTSAYPLIFANLFLRMSQYGQLANLTRHLSTHATKTATYKKQDKADKITSHIALLLNSITEHDYRPSLKEFLIPFTAPVKARFR